MGVLHRLAGALGYERRSATSNSYAAAFGIRPTASGQYVNATLAENLAAVSACIGAISSAMASLPAYVYRVGAVGRTEVPNHPVARLLRRPNGNQTWPDWMEWTMGQVLAHGNAISAVEYDGAGQPTALVPIHWGNVSVSVLPSGRLAYDVVQYVAPWGGTGKPRRLLDGEVFHLRDRSDDGLIGRSRISRAPDVIGNAMALQEYSGNAWRNGVTPSGALEMPGSLGNEQFNRLRQMFEERHAGTSNARQVLILDNGAAWKPMSVSPEDAEILSSRKYGAIELARLFQVPPPIIQAYENNAFTSAQQASLWFAQLTLAPWATKVQAEFSRSVFGEGDHSLEIDLSGLMRGDYEARWKANVAAVAGGILSADEVREMEGWNPRGTAAAVA
jgi:HK97 family phage portal protein